MFKHFRWINYNPFKSDKPLCLTLHSKYLENLPSKEQKALEGIRKFSFLSHMKIMQTSEGGFPFASVSKVSDDEYVAKQIFGDGWQRQLVILPSSFDSFVLNFLTESNSEESLDDAKLQIATAKSYSMLGQQILITTCSYLLLPNLEKNDVTTSIVALYPSQAIKVIGLLLRSRGHFLDTTSSNLYYWRLTCYKLPNLLHYTRLCSEISKEHNINFSRLLGSVTKRAQWALETRDKIALLWYQRHNEQIAYYFHYLTLLIIGVFDSLARITQKLYQIPESKNKKKVKVAFWDSRFLELLKSMSYSYELIRVLESPEFVNFIPLVKDIRNTIHAEGLSVLSTVEIGFYEKETILLTVPDTIPKAAEKHSSKKEWGVDTLLSSMPRIEPYTYADKMLKESFELIDKIAAATPLRKLYTGVLSPQEPKDEEYWSKESLENLELFGW